MPLTLKVKCIRSQKSEETQAADGSKINTNEVNIFQIVPDPVIGASGNINLTITLPANTNQYKIGETYTLTL